MKKFTIKDGEKNHQESTTPIYSNLTFTQNFPRRRKQKKRFVVDYYCYFFIRSPFLSQIYCYHKFEFMIIQGMQLMEENERLRQQVIP